MNANATQTAKTQTKAQEVLSSLEAAKATATARTTATREVLTKVKTEVGGPVSDLFYLAKAALTTDEAKAFIGQAGEVLGAISWSLVHVVLTLGAWGLWGIATGVEAYQDRQSVYREPTEAEAEVLALEAEAVSPEEVEAPGGANFYQGQPTDLNDLHPDSADLSDLEARWDGKYVL